MENYVACHLHTVYSTQDSIATPKDVVEAAIKNGHSACAITDHGNMSGTYVFQEECLKAGIKPLLGMEGYYVDQLVATDTNGKRKRLKNNHLITLAKNENGWKALLKLNYLANKDEDHFYYKPRNSFDELFRINQEHKGGLIVSSACLASPFSNLLKLGREDEAVKLFEKFCTEFGEDFYAELQLNEIEEQKNYNNWLISQATHYGIPLIIAGDCHYVTKDGAIAQETMFNIRKEDENEVGQEFACRSLYYHNINDFKQFNKQWNYDYTDNQIETWCGNTVDIANKISFTIPQRTKMLLPRMAYNEDDEMVMLSKKGLSKHFNCTYEECPKEYRDQLENELKLFIKKGIARYLLCLADSLKWCDDNKISRGCARGSGGGSLVLTCMGITKWSVDMIKNKLIFERFVSEERLPNCMIDYSKSGQL